MENVKRIKVVGALIWNKDKKFLICQRPKNKARALCWEFVGGKVEKGETEKEAIIRECQEELNIKVRPIKKYIEVNYDYPDISISLIIYLCQIVKGSPTLIEHEQVKWIKPSQIDEYEFCPADVNVLKKIKTDSEKE